MVRIVPSPTTEACFPTVVAWLSCQAHLRSAGNLGPTRCAFLHRSPSGGFIHADYRTDRGTGRKNTSGFPLPPSWNEGRRLGRRPSFCFPGPRDGDRSTYGTIGRMEITWYGGSCVRLKGREGVVAADPYRAIVGPTGRGLTADIVTFSHAEDELVAARGKAKDAGPRSRYLGVPCPRASRARSPSIHPVSTRSTT